MLLTAVNYLALVANMVFANMVFRLLEQVFWLEV